MSSSTTLKRAEFDFREIWRQSFGNQDRQDIKSLANYLCEAHSQKRIGNETFTLLLECLLSFYIEKRLEERLYKKSEEFDRRLTKYLMGSMLFE